MHFSLLYRTRVQKQAVWFNLLHQITLQMKIDFKTFKHLRSEVSIIFEAAGSVFKL